MGKKIAIDVYYFDNNLAKAVGVVFNDWEDQSPSEVIEAWPTEFGPYIPGEFYKRELPCIMSIIEKIPDLGEYDAIILDGFAHLPSSWTDGLGMKLEAELSKRGILNRKDQIKPGIIGVAKSKFSGADQFPGTVEVYRGTAKTPLYVNTTGYEYSADDAAKIIKRMYGTSRIPDLLKILDKLTKTK